MPIHPEILEHAKAHSGAFLDFLHAFEVHDHPQLRMEYVHYLNSEIAWQARHLVREPRVNQSAPLFGLGPPLSDEEKMREREEALEECRDKIRRLSRQVDDYYEFRCEMTFDAARLPGALEETWTELVDQTIADKNSMDVEFITDLHRRLAERAGGNFPGQFKHPEQWRQFLEHSFIIDGEWEDGSSIMILYWGGHLPCLAHAVGWMSQAAFRLSQDALLIFPDKLEDYEDLFRPTYMDSSTFQRFPTWSVEKSYDGAFLPNSDYMVRHPVRPACF